MLLKFLLFFEIAEKKDNFEIVIFGSFFKIFILRAKFICPKRGLIREDESFAKGS